MTAFEGIIEDPNDPVNWDLVARAYCNVVKMYCAYKPGQSCEEAALAHDPPLALGTADAHFSGHYLSKGCYTYSAGHPFAGTAFWSTGSGDLDGDKVALTVDFVDDDADQGSKVLCNLTVATPDYHTIDIEHIGAFPQVAVFRPIIHQACPRACEGQWVGDCKTESRSTCSDLYTDFPCVDGEDPNDPEACHKISGWNNPTGHVCGESDQFQANQLVSQAVLAIASDHHDDCHACREMSNFVAALEMCECAGARLCTIAELEDDVTKNTGCNFDMARVWSSSRTRGSEVCDSLTERWTVAGSQEFEDRFPAACRDFTELLAVRCCADTHIGNLQDQRETYKITQPADGAGAACPHDDGDRRESKHTNHSRCVCVLCRLVLTDCLWLQWCATRSAPVAGARSALLTTALSTARSTPPSHSQPSLASTR
jgi:hypothetical protein